MPLTYDEYRASPIVAMLRHADEATVASAMADLTATPELTSPACKLEFFNRMLDQLLGEHDE